MIENTIKKSHKKLVIGIATAIAVLAIAGGGIAYKLHLDEQERIAIAAACEKADKSLNKAIKTANSEIKKAEEALKAATDEAIQAATPGATTYQERGKKLIQAVTDAKTKLAKLVDAKTAKCETRETAKALASSATDIAKQAKDLPSTVAQLSKDVEAFKAEEATRIEAERIAAEQKAAEEAAAAAAAAAQAQAATTSYSGGYVANNSGGGYVASGGSGAHMGPGVSVIPNPSDNYVPPPTWWPKEGQ